MNSINIAPDELEFVRTILDRHLPHSEVWVFGSRVSDKAKPFSDLDLAILDPMPLSDEVRADLMEDFRESDLRFKVDLVDWATTSPQFRKIIEAKHAVLKPPRARTAGSPD